MNILGVEAPEIDYLDVDVMEKVNDAFQKVVEDIQDNGQYEGLTNTDAIRHQCAAIDKFLDTVFGEGTAQRVFKGKVHYGQHLEAFGIVSEYVQEQKGGITDLVDKYSPNRISQIPQNRQQRRYNDRKNGKRRNNGQKDYVNRSGNMGGRN